MKIDTKKLAEYSTIQYEYSRVSQQMYSLFYPQRSEAKSIESMFETMKYWTPDQVAELFDGNGDLDRILYSQAMTWSDELNTVRLFIPGDSPHKRVVLVDLCRLLVCEALRGIFNVQSKNTSLKTAHISCFAGSYEVPTDLKELADGFVSKEFILNAFDSDTCWIEFE